MITRTLPLLLILGIIISSNPIQAKNNNTGIKPKTEVNSPTDSLKWSIHFLDKILNSGGEWYLTEDAYHKPLKGVLDYAQNDPVDTVVVKMHKILSDEKVVYLFDRRPQDIRNLSNIKGYISNQDIQKRLENIQKRISDSLGYLNIPIPESIIKNSTVKAPVIPQGEPSVIMAEKEHELPLAFKNRLYQSYNELMNKPDLLPLAMDSLRNQIFNSCRKSYNDSILTLWRSIAIVDYRNQYIANYAKAKADSEKSRIDKWNLKILNDFNDKEVGRVNDSLKYALKILTSHAEADSVLMRLYNLGGDKSELWTANRETSPIRMYLKNPQNDSLSVVLINEGKGKIKMIIDDGVVFSHIRESQKKEITFHTVQPDNKLKQINIKKPDALPWTLDGFGSVGFTQTALSNWANGGESSLSTLMIGKYKANYSKNKLRWENSAEIRYGITKTKTRGFQKNDDKIELQTRFGYSAFKKWFYSGEANFKTQMAPGYNFPDMKNPISEFMSPGYLTFSIGLDYKPNANFSLFLSPISSKATFVSDTSKIKPVNFGLEPGTKRLWEPGLIIKSNWKKKIAENITYDTKAQFFNNYLAPFKKCSFDWEETLTMQVNHYINIMVMTELIYDYNVKFPVYDANNKVINRKPKWQFKELFNIGFNYKF
jgi:hypothetical protein